MGWEAAIFIFNSMTAGLSPQSPRPVGWDNSAVSSGEISRTHVSQLTCQQESQCFLKLTPQVVNKKRETKSGPRHRSKIGSALTVSFFKQLPQLSFGEKRWKGKRLNLFLAYHWKMPSSLLKIALNEEILFW